ncbi:phage fiber-tail adaptor protein [Commensalibacter papalotli (ex Servin-Garciduenas et al. 2014)]|uniref:Uncharacterized protein n=1 Tax=Commensalibacter papalotli (ex Servin-Garciduenas et al. 2014) TaxID=1208583 RepID=W7DZ02_9PROT|nr:hypothetical protein [Commensalibacter papalotli (ex Servin-Garciduenas et al. 2014)]EUK19238.1 hypothetical protein COMX_05790 [Commensalibacter papalotli (ex Servin-Garciduenas et al. 2014)]
MEIISSFNLNPLRIYTVPKRIKNKKGIATFPSKHIASYLDYSVDFSNQMNDGEIIIQGKTLCNHSGIQINSSFFKEHSLTVFLSDGKENRSFYLTFIIKTNQGNEFFQEIILPTYGCFIDNISQQNFQFIALDKESNNPHPRPPLNALAIDGRYLIYNKNSYIMV